ncbi:hypothetical protein GCM10027062_33030 [Nocardioides hungaricus]
MRALSLSATALLAAVALTACGGAGDKTDASESESSAPPKTMSLSGTLSLIQEDPFLLSGGPKPGKACSGDDALSDISDGTQVTISDSTGAAVGLAELTGGQYVEGANFDPDGPDYDCQFTFSATNVPATSDIYSFDLEGHPSIKFTKDEAGSLALDLKD